MAFFVADPHGGMSIPLAMLIVFGAAKLFGELAERLRQPAIVGEIIAGAIVGPSVLGWIQPNEVLTALSELGVMFLLFRVGLEVKASELMHVGGQAFGVAMLGVLAPMAMGWGIMRGWGFPQIEAVFVGAAMVATSVGITAQVLAAKGLLQEKTAKIILGAAVIDDILGLLVLAIVSSAAKGEVRIGEIAATAVMALGFTVIIAKWGTQVMQRLVPGAESKLKSGEAQFNLALVLLFALSVLAMYVGVAAIIGAFLAGMALAESVSDRVHDLAHGITELLVPFFLAGIGLHFDLTAFADRSLLVLAMIIVVAAVFSKLVGCGLGAAGLGFKEALRVGSGMVPRGEVGMVVAQLGLSMAVIEKPVYSVVVFMAVATTVIAPAMLNYAYKDVVGQTPTEDFQIG